MTPQFCPRLFSEGIGRNRTGRSVDQVTGRLPPLSLILSRLRQVWHTWLLGAEITGESRGCLRLPCTLPIHIKCQPLRFVYHFQPVGVKPFSKNLPHLRGCNFMPLSRLRSLFRQTTLVNPRCHMCRGASLVNDLIGKSHQGWGKNLWAMTRRFIHFCCLVSSWYG